MTQRKSEAVETTQANLQPKHPLRGVTRRAEYTKKGLKEFQGNPYIEALPARLSADEFMTCVRSHHGVYK